MVLKDLQDYKDKSKTSVFKRQDDTYIPRINRIWCSSLLVFFVILSGTKHWVDRPIACLCPANFKDLHVKYVDAHCWIQNTYAVPNGESLPKDLGDREDTEIVYYQWVPIIFLIQALMFVLPRRFWIEARNISGLNLSNLQNSEDEEGKEADESQNAASYIDKWVTVRNGLQTFYSRNRGKPSIMIGKSSGLYIASMYTVSCFLYAMSTIGQFFFLDWFLQNDFKRFGLDFIQHVYGADVWADTARFPRSTFCDVFIRQMTNVQPYTMQCSLPINLYYERMFLFMWFLLITMSVLNIYNFCTTFSTLFIHANRLEYVRKRLAFDSSSSSLCVKSQRNRHFVKFVEEYLQVDGVFVLYSLDNNSGVVASCSILRRLWNIHNDTMKHRDTQRMLTQLQT